MLYMEHTGFISTLKAFSHLAKLALEVFNGNVLNGLYMNKYMYRTRSNYPNGQNNY